MGFYLGICHAQWSGVLLVRRQMWKFGNNQHTVPHSLVISIKIHYSGIGFKSDDTLVTKPHFPFITRISCGLHLPVDIIMSSFSLPGTFSWASVDFPLPLPWLYIPCPSGLTLQASFSKKLLTAASFSPLHWLNSLLVPTPPVLTSTIVLIPWFVTLSYSYPSTTKL